MFENLATPKFRWLALVFLALGLAIVIIDNTVLSVAIPYILRDFNTDLPSLEWVISGYALIIATLLITTGRLGDLIGRKKVFILGTILFAIGSFIASISNGVPVLFLGEALIEAIGAAMMLTSSLSLLASEFQGRERAIAFGIWGAVAGSAATVGPLLGGFLTTYYSWRWSLRINVFVALVAIAGSVFIQESRGEEGKEFDWWGTLLSALGLFSLVFALIEGSRYGWWKPISDFIVLGVKWPFTSISIIPFAFALAVIFLAGFLWVEFLIEKRKGSPLLELSLFKNWAFAIGLITVGILSLGQVGLFFIFPLFLQNVVGYTAFQTGLVFLPASITILVIGATSGFIASKVGPKWLVSAGMFILAAGILAIFASISSSTTWVTLSPALIVFGLGLGMGSAQLTNIVISSVPVGYAGEASGTNATLRQVGSSIGVAIIGAVLTTTLAARITDNINTDSFIPTAAKQQIIDQVKDSSVQLGTTNQTQGVPTAVSEAVKEDVKQSIVSASRQGIFTAFWFVLAGAVASLFIPARREEHTAWGGNGTKKETEKIPDLA